jgi:peptide/nickel transport system substrate-binding protein
VQVCLWAGCRDDEPAPKGRPKGRDGGAAAVPKKPSKLRIQADRIPSNLNPMISSDPGSWRIAFRNVLEPLVLVQSNGAYQPFLAASMEVRARGRVFRFRLRPDITFHDGRPLTSADVVYTLETLRKRQKKRRASFDLLGAELTQMAEVRAVGASTIDVVLRRTNYMFPSVLAEIGILPSHLYKRRGLINPQLNRAPVGTGPFRVGDRDGNRRLVLERNDAYWGRHARMAEVEFIAIVDPAKALASLRNGELEILPGLHPSYFPAQLKKGHMPKRFRALRLHPYRMRALIYNLKRRHLRDRRVRVALARLSDRQRLVREVRNNLGQVLSAPFWTLSRSYNQKIHPYSYDRRAASRLLDAAGWQDAKGKGKRRRMGWPLKVSLLRARRASRGTRRAAQMLKTELNTAGIVAEIRVGDFGFILSQLRRGRFDAVLLGISPRPDSDLTPMLHSKGALNVGRYHNPRVDRTLDALRATSSPSARGQLMGSLHRLLHDDPPMTILWAPIEIMVVDRRVRGLANNGRWPVLSTLSFRP